MSRDSDFQYSGKSRTPLFCVILQVLLAVLHILLYTDGMIEREITPRLVALFKQYPFVTVTGPRQSGKTTLCRNVFPNLEYVNLEAPDQREFAESDPRAFLARLDDGAILDEIQRVPSLLSYLQVLADEKGRNGLFVLTGSEQFSLSDAIGQSLAGRTALLRILPFTLAERRQTGASNEMDDILFSGFYPRIHDQGLEPRQALGDYFETYVERDVRQIGEIRNLSSFQRFVRLCAGRVGQLVNLSSLGSDAGVSHTTAREWLTILEASYIVFQLQPYHSNVRKRLVKSPKIYFYDVGLASYLIGIENAKQIATHPLRGSLFENVVVIEALKHRFNRGNQPNLTFFRDERGLECDLFYKIGQGIGAFEAKSGSTVGSDFFDSLNHVAKRVSDITKKVVVYGGTDRQFRSDCEVVPLVDMGAVLGRFEAVGAVAAFVDDNRGQEASKSDIDTTDSVYRTQVQPTIDALDTTLSRLATELFHSFEASFTLKYGQQEAKQEGMLYSFHWEQAKLRFLLKPEFTLKDSRPLVLSHNCSFLNYTGRGSKDFSLLIAVVWELGAESFSQRVMLNEAPIPELETRTLYVELDKSSAEVDGTVALVTQSVLLEIQRLSS